jgi:hypothetical protein
MTPGIVFLVMSAVHRSDSIDQLARSLAPHTVLVHHDFAQTPDFTLSSPNVVFVPEPRRTGWASWGFTEAIFHSLNHALAHLEFEYVQVLSPSCLPIKPISRFEAFIRTTDQDAHFGCVDVCGNRDAMMSAGFRAFAPRDSWRYRALFRLSRTYFGLHPGTLDTDGIQLHTGYVVNARGAMTWRSRSALLATLAFRHGRIARHPFDVDNPIFFGAPWFGARRAVVREMCTLFDDRAFTAHFEHVFAADEFILPTMLHRVSRRPGPINHLVNTFEHARPKWLTAEDIVRLRNSPAYFARKFVDSCDDPCRLLTLTELLEMSVPAPTS